MAKRIFIAILLFLSCCTPQDYSHIKVLEVIYGDTVRLSNGYLLRYIGLDTPEVRIRKGGRFIYSPQPFSLEAKEFNRKLVENKFIKLEFDVVKKDKYGRLLGYCFVGDKFVNAELIKEGYASLYTFPPNVKYVDLFVKLQKEAREGAKGFWGGYKTVDSGEAYKYINQIRTVRGRVLSTYQSQKCVFLNFGQDYKTDFTIVVFNNSLKYFKDKGIEPVSFYRGKIVQVTGKIREYNGPEIIVNSPLEMEVINSP